MNRIACVVFLFLAASAVAAPPADIKRDATTVEVVQVPVYVAAQGHAVRGLTRDDFKLFVNGKPQPIDYFDVVDFAAADQSTDPRQRRLYLLVFDLLFSSPDTIFRAQEAAAKYVDTAPAGDYFAVGAYTSNRGVQIAVPFTRDRLAVRRAISRLGENGNGDPLRLAMTLGERSAIAGAQRLFDGGIEARSGSYWANDLMSGPVFRLAEDQVNSLAELAARLGPIEGQKHVVLLSTGFDATRILGGVASDPFRRTGMGGEPVRRVNAYFADPRVTGSLRDMHASFNAAGVVLDAVDIYGLAGPFEARNNTALYSMAIETGGTVADNANDLRLAIQRLADRQRVVYLLGFHAPATNRKDNAISVSVRNAPGGSRVNYRRAYSTTLPEASATDGLRLADIIQNDMPQSGVSVTAKATTAARRATVTVDIPPAELSALGGNDGDALIYIYSGTAAVAFQQKAIGVDRAQLTQDFELPPGRYAAKVLVRWDGALGYARTDFTVE